MISFGGGSFSSSVMGSVVDSEVMLRSACVLSNLLVGYFIQCHLSPTSAIEFARSQALRLPAPDAPRPQH